GNVVHRYLQIAAGLLKDRSPAELLTEMSGWKPRLVASLRSEGLPPTLLEREAERALHALEQTAKDAEGLWILSPQPGASTERPLTLATAKTLRVDRSFLAGATPLSSAQTHTWIVDFKTGTARGLSDVDFEREERRKYGDQLIVYASAARALSPDSPQIMLGLYYPLIPRLLWWPA
ncbi:MAG: hypothetical protein ABI142_05290, partial [Bryocella sp.]